MRVRRALLLAAILSTSTEGWAAEAIAKADSASGHFRNGLESAQRGDLEGALHEFEAAYATQPHFSVLFNIAQAQASLGRPVEAIASFERYLREAGDQIGSERRQQVSALIAANRRLTGKLRLIVAAPATTRVWLDGEELVGSLLSQTIPLKIGKHTLLHSSGAGFPRTEELTIRPEQTLDVRIPAPRSATDTQPGALVVSCGVPAVHVHVIGQAERLTPLKRPIPLPPGRYRVRFSRPGYSTAEREIEVESHRRTALDCSIKRQKPLPAKVAAQLQVVATPKDALLAVDGAPLDASPLPAGPHVLRGERDGFLPKQQRILLTAGRPLVQRLVLEPTPAHAQREARARAHQRTLGYLALGTGAALLAGAGTVYVWNSGRYDDFRSSTGGSIGRAVSIQRADDAAIGLAVLGALSGVVGGLVVYGWETE